MFRSLLAKQRLRTGRERLGEPPYLARKGIASAVYAAAAAGVALAAGG
jgi:hypothetical protein